MPVGDRSPDNESAGREITDEQRETVDPPGSGTARFKKGLTALAAHPGKGGADQKDHEGKDDQHDKIQLHHGCQGLKQRTAKRPAGTCAEG